MKTLFSLLICLGTMADIFCQSQPIETQSITIENFIGFVVDQTSRPKDSTKLQNITLLLETYNDSFNVEDKTVLKHGLKLLSKSLLERDIINIVAYSKYNGIVKLGIKGSNLKLLLNSIEQPNIQEVDNYGDGIDLAYHIAKENYIQGGINKVIMVRNPNAKLLTNALPETVSLNQENKPSAAGNTVVLTAIALLPELIKVIKN